MKIFLNIILVLFAFSYFAQAAEVNNFPPYNEPITIAHIEKIFEQTKNYKYFKKMDSDIPEAGAYSYCFSIGIPQISHLIQAGILWNRELLYLTWWNSERRDTRIIASALLLTLDRVDIDIFSPPDPKRFNEYEKKLRIQENNFVIDNLEYFYDRYYSIFRKVLGENNSFVNVLKNKNNLDSQYIKRYKPEQKH